MDFDQYRIANRHLSESQVRDNFADRTGQSAHDVDDRLWSERQSRNEYYDRLDRGQY